MALDASGQPLVSTSNPTGPIGNPDGYALQLARHTRGTSWDRTIPSPSGGPNADRETSLVIDGAGSPIVAWSDFQTAAAQASTIHVARWPEAGGWDTSYGQVDAIAASNTGARSPSLGINSSGQLFVAWTEPGSFSTGPTVPTVFAARWMGTSWDTSYGGINVIGAAEPGLRFDSSGQPVLGWCCSLNGGGVSRWSGGAWTNLPAYPTSGTSGVTMFALDSMQRPVVAATMSNVHVLYYAANLWQDMTQPIPSGGSQPGEASLVLTAAGQPVVVWTEVNVSERVVGISRYTGTLWITAYGTLNAVQGSGSDASRPVLLLDKLGFPIVAWAELDGPSMNLNSYVWRSNL